MHQEKIWEFYQGDGVSSFDGNKSRLSFLSKKTNAGKTVLNIGVGNGFLEKILIAKGVNVYSLDPSVQAIEGIRSRLELPETCAKQGYSQDIPFADQIFDVVFMSEVIEHLDDDVLVETFQEVKRVLKPGGLYIGTVPADENLEASMVVCPHCGKFFHRWGHEQSFSKERLELLLQPFFADIELKRMYFGNWRQLNWKGKLIWILKKFMILLGIKGAGENFYYSATKPA